MYEYTIKAYEQTDFGKINSVDVVVQANNETEAIARAGEIVPRPNFTILQIKELNREIKKTKE